MVYWEKWVSLFVATLLLVPFFLLFLNMIRWVEPTELELAEMDQEFAEGFANAAQRSEAEDATEAESAESVTLYSIYVQEVRAGVGAFGFSHRFFQFSPQKAVGYVGIFATLSVFGCVVISTIFPRVIYSNSREYGHIDGTKAATSDGSEIIEWTDFDDVVPSVPERSVEPSVPDDLNGGDKNGD